MNGIESEALRFSHACARMNRDLQLPLARVRRVEQHQQTLVNWLNPADQSPLRPPSASSRWRSRVTASIAERERTLPGAGLPLGCSKTSTTCTGMRPDGPGRRQGCQHLLQSYTDILPGRPTSVEHRRSDDLRTPYDRRQAALITKLHACTLMAGEHQTHDYYMNIGPTFSDPIARQLYAEIASIEEQHVTQYKSIIDATETWLEKWLLHEATEVYNYFSCVEYESNPHIKRIWERFLDYELGHLRFVADLFEQTERATRPKSCRRPYPSPSAMRATATSSARCYRQRST